MVQKKFSVGIVGGTGYTGLELLRLLLPREEIEISAIVSRSAAGKSIGEVFRGFEKYPLVFQDLEIDSLKNCDLVFYATPHKVAMGQVRTLINSDVKVVDLSADFRLKDHAEFTRWYCEHHDPELIQEAVYGLVEHNRTQIKDAQLVANPGCYPTSILLPLSPLLRAGLIDENAIFIDSKSGVSGAGKSLTLGNLYAENSENFQAYGVQGHRHLPEIVQQLNEFAAREVNVTFVPHLLPLIRGIESTIYCQLKPNVKLEDVYQAWHAFYADETFVTIKEGISPCTKEVRGTNNCAFGAFLPQEDRGARCLVISSVIDNLMKGASGQAVQNMNLMLGLEETQGLLHFPLA